MLILFVRHAAAEDRAQFAGNGLDDSLRPLTSEGRKRMRQAVKGLRRAVGHLDVIATSQLVRAVETAGLLERAFEKVRTIELTELDPASPVENLCNWIGRQPAAASIALVGHEPHLGRCISLLLAGRKQSILSLKKGAACLLEFTGDPTPGNARLLWCMKCGHLAKLGE